VYGTCTGASILFIILAAEQMETIFGSDIMDPKLWSLIFVGATLPFVPIKTLGHVAFISLFGALASAVVFVVVVAMVC
jgi:amino acid permease